ncbi:forkhead box protein M1 isoform X1 [Fundulus heteroclitus]|uniref:forkhead box protein M1 isoform X1 n=1 Tax=Fundulus heteroclitus TaxID=8078 RepID=UPI00165B4692|nr:forkhead box protein M1 isoform X1 [Fundulus heteroclitus]XP_021180422.2 forkhead box protein M1 isoform X1 [Fundulus heteroclitus]
MRRSPRRPLILKRRKLPFQQNEPTQADKLTQPCPPGPGEPPKPAASQCFPHSIPIMDHPSMSDTQVVVIPKEADLQRIIGMLTAKGKESGVQGPNKFILLSESGSRGNGSLCQAAVKEESSSAERAAEQPVKSQTVHVLPDAKPLTGIQTHSGCSPLDDSLTNIQWLGKMNTSALEPHLANQIADTKKRPQEPQNVQAHGTHPDPEGAPQPAIERPPYSYTAMIQFAINSRKNRGMTLKEIYTWIEDHFPYYREVAKPGWKNSIRHNLSLHDMFIRERSPDGKTSFWTIRPDINRCLTLDQVYRPCCDPGTLSSPVPMLSCPHQQEKKNIVAARKAPASSERRMKPLLPRTDSYLVPIQLPIASPAYLPPLAASYGPAASKHKQNVSRATKRVRIAPKVTESSAPAVAPPPQKEPKVEPASVPVKREARRPPPKRQSSGSRRKQSLVNSLQDEPILLCPDTSFFDSGVASDASAFQDARDADVTEPQHGGSPERELYFKTPVKSHSHLSSSTPSKPPPDVALEPWKETPAGKDAQSVLDFSPIRTPGGPAVTPRQDYTTFSFSSTPFKELPLFSSPRELLGTGARGQPSDSPTEPLQAGAAGASPSNRSVAEGLILDTMNDSLSKILVDISFSALDDEDLGIANISLSEFLGQFM